jgi:hypothetical protein
VPVLDGIIVLRRDAQLVQDAHDERETAEAQQQFDKRQARVSDGHAP